MTHQAVAPGDPALDHSTKMMLDTVRDVAAGRVAPGVIERDREERFDRGLVRELGQLDLLGGIVPTEYGGTGLSHVAFSALLQEMSRTDHLMGLVMSFPSGLAGAGLLQYGSEEQKQEFLPRLCRGELIFSAGVTEPGSGTGVADMQTTCRREGDHYVIDGAKTWISLIDVCDYVLTFATLDRSGGRGAVCAFLVPRDTPGLTLRPFKNKLGFRGVATGEVFLEGVTVPAANRVGEEGQGYGVAMAAVETGRLGVASRALGLAQDCLDRSTAYARERIVQGQEIGRYQLVQSMVTDMVVGIDGARAMTYDYAAKRDEGLRARREASLAKMHASDVAMSAATAAVQIHGAYGTHEEYHVARHFRDAKVFQIVEGQNQLHRSMVAEYALGYRGAA
ncbi:acyl-CoA dehydrogenase family protein [Conexibacter sp. SYSU D00693]|uniref:acyl-CoA dehydrogenase family protein n=1 Tax=Conexibacter sp. SYSU D00693 TaxID=2812560 RepID=UPI00196ADE62|nr:acyl-CoA dehydrogenase family protein [Conexibacter sp. SYSU D00693]